MDPASRSNTATGVGLEQHDEPNPENIFAVDAESRNDGTKPISRQEGQVKFWRWLYRRIGQIACFAVAALLMLSSLTAYQPLAPAFGAAVLFAVALILRHQMIKRFYLS